MSSSECPLNLDRTRRELCPHGTAEFPCDSYDEQFSDTSTQEFPWHWHDEFEVITVNSGCLCVQVPGKIFELRTGDSIFINSGVLHYGKSAPRCTIHSLVFSPLLVSGAAGSAIDKKYIQPIVHCAQLDAFLWTADTGGLTGGMTFFAEAAFTALQTDAAGTEFTVRENLSRISFLLYEKFKSGMQKTAAAQNTDSIRIQKMMTFIQNHFAEPLTLAQIASASAVGERECLRCFNRSIQISPVQYLINCRLHESAAMLVKKRTSCIAEIALACGFASPGSFTQLFRRMYKCTPSEYRTLHK